ncbi:MAG: hypothetical protein WA924_05130 [Burkholderiaceae bacterium]
MAASDPLLALNRLFMQALLQMGESGQVDAACRLAAQGWSLLRQQQPHEAERLNGVMHSLCRRAPAIGQKSPSGEQPAVQPPSS